MGLKFVKYSDWCPFKTVLFSAREFSQFSMNDLQRRVTMQRGRERMFGREDVSSQSAIRLKQDT